jgi:hypothetical protein
MEYNVASAYKYMAHIIANDLPRNDYLRGLPPVSFLAIPTAHSPRACDWGTESFYVNGVYSNSTGTSMMICKGLQAEKRKAEVRLCLGQEAAKSLVCAQTGRPKVV